MPDLAPARRRPRILFADDQRSVARTLSALLDPLGVEVRFADDGEAALRRLQNELFDLVLVDLAMPPDDAGGLWLLRRVAELGIGTPAVVLSGQEGQADTIEAQRLGAVDHVVKHKASEELAKVVGDVLEDARTERWRRATTDLPARIAIPLVEARLQTDPLHRLRDSLGCVEAIFRFTALVAASTCREVLIEHFERPPAMGAWRSFCTVLSKQGGVAPGVGAWLDAVLDRSAGDLVATRNEVVHGSGPTVAWAVDRQAQVDDWLALFVTAATTRTTPRTVVPGKLEHIGQDFLVDIADLAGGATTVSWDRLRADAPMRTGRVHLVTADAPPVDLWPLVLADPASRAGQWDIKVLESVTRRRTLRYLDLSERTRRELGMTVDDLTP